MVADKSFGLTLLHGSVASNAQVSYVKRLGRPPDGKGHVFLFCGIESCGTDQRKVLIQ